MKMLKHIFQEIVFPNRDRHAIPPLDGPYRPNSVLQDAKVLGVHTQPPVGLSCDLAGNLFFGVGNNIFRRDKSGSEELVAALQDEITCLTFDSSRSALLAGTIGGGITVIGGPRDGIRWYEADGERIQHPTALSVDQRGNIFVAEGSRINAPKNMMRDLMEKRRTGRVIRIDAESGLAQTVADNLGYPSGLLCRDDGSVLVSEAWTHRLLRLTPTTAKPTAVIPNLAGYPGHISAGNTGFVISFFAVRTHLVELLLDDDGYRVDMMRSVPQEYWVAPSLNANENLLTPLQFGRIKVHGATKPWAPPRSYGLIVEYNEDAIPLRSFHSRTDGDVHGITSACVLGGSLYATSHARSAVIQVG